MNSHRYPVVTCYFTLINYCVIVRTDAHDILLYHTKYGAVTQNNMGICTQEDTKTPCTKKLTIQLGYQVLKLPSYRYVVFYNLHAIFS